jgi:hypothetical protein
MAVVSQRSRLFGQRKVRDALGKFRIVEIAVIDLGVEVGLAHQAVAVEAVGDARRLRQMVSRRLSGSSCKVFSPLSDFFSTPTLVVAKEGM